nr:ribonuclease H-like domain, reverse transcriptase, RNA-dependent DNA polymerase [Tanacetum cinerariifolium]
MDLQDQGVINSGCSRHMIGNMSYLIDYEEIDEGYVAFRGNPKGGKITRKCTIKTGTQSNGFLCTKASDNTCQARKEIEPVKDYILLPLWTADLPFSQDPKSSNDDGYKPSSDDGKKVDEDPRNKNEFNVVGENISVKLLFDPNIFALEDVSTFDFSRDDEDDAVADINSLDITIQVGPIPTTKIHKYHPLDQVLGDLQSATQTRKMSKNLEEHGFVSTIQQRTNHKDLQNCLFACFLSQEEPKKMSSMGELTFFLGLQVKQKKDGIFISQDKYVAEILKKLGFIEVKTASTPMETQKHLLKDEDGEEVDVHMYRTMIGSLMYLTSSRPDIIASNKQWLEIPQQKLICGCFKLLWTSALDLESTT